MTDLTLSAFCKKFSACSNGISFGKGLTKRKGSAKMSKLWDMHIQNRDYLLWVVTCEGVFSDITLRKMAIAFAREVESLHPICKPTLDVVEKYTNGEATQEELAAAGEAARAARAAAREAAREAAGEAAREAAWEAAGGAAGEAAWAARAAAREAAREAAWGAAWAAWDTAREAAWDAAWAAVGDAAWDAAWAAWDAAWAATRAAAEKRQIEIIYSFSNPFTNDKEWTQ